MDGSVSIGVTGSYTFKGVGASTSITIGRDSEGKVCVVYTTCARIGIGTSGGDAVNIDISETDFIEGDTATGGVFYESGSGNFGGASVGLHPKLTH